MTNKLRFGDGSVTIEMSDTLDVIARRAIEDVHPGLIDAISTETEKVYRQAKARWPVGRDRQDRTYHSKDRWRWEMVVSSDYSTIRGRIVNDADWVYMVKPRFLWGQSGVNELVRKPMRQAHKRLVNSLGDLVASRLGGK